MYITPPKNPHKKTNWVKWAEDINSYLCKEHADGQPHKKMLNITTNQEVQIETAMRYHSHLSEQLKSKTQTSVGKDVEKENQDLILLKISLQNIEMVFCRSFYTIFPKKKTQVNSIIYPYLCHERYGEK